MFLLVPASLQGSAKIFALCATSFLRYVSVASLLSRGHVDGDACGMQLFFFLTLSFIFQRLFSASDVVVPITNLFWCPK